MNEINKEKIKIAVSELLEKGNTDIIEGTFSTEYVAYAGEKEYSGHSFIRQYVDQLRTAIPDVRVLDVKFLAQDKETITWQRTLEGTHKKDMRGIPASGMKIKWHEMVVSHFVDGMIVKEWLISELMGELLLKVASGK